MRKLKTAAVSYFNTYPITAGLRDMRAAARRRLAAEGLDETA